MATTNMDHSSRKLSDESKMEYGKEVKGHGETLTIATFDIHWMRLSKFRRQWSVSSLHPIE